MTKESTEDLRDALFKYSQKLSHQEEQLRSLSNTNTELSSKYCDLKVKNDALSLKLEYALKECERVEPLEREVQGLKE